jgi:hypothetical protein
VGIVVPIPTFLVVYIPVSPLLSHLGTIVISAKLGLIGFVATPSNSSEIILSPVKELTPRILLFSAIKIALESIGGTATHLIPPVSFTR